MCLKDTGLSLHIETHGHLFITSTGNDKSNVTIKFHKKMAGLIGISDDFLIKYISEYVYITLKTFCKKNGSNIMICEEFTKPNSLQEIPNECFSDPQNIHFTLSPWVFV